MRNIVFVLAFIVSANMFAQSDLKSEKDNFIVGISGGATFSQVDGDTYGGYHQFGFSAGGFVYRKISKSFDIQMDLGFKQKGSYDGSDAEKGDYSVYYIKLNYIEFPIVARFHFWRMAAEGGVSFGALLSSNEGDENGDYQANPFRPYEVGTILGFNYYFTKQVWLNMRYGYSLTAIRLPYEGEVDVYQPKENLFFNREPGQYNSYASMSLNYAFR